MHILHAMYLYAWINILYIINSEMGRREREKKPEQ